MDFSQQIKSTKNHKIDAKRIIAVTSCKGGVGKTTTAVNLATALKQLNYQVGLLDADIYGPNINCLLSSDHIKAKVKEQKFLPIEQNGLQILSMGSLIDQDQALVWRAPMAIKSIQQMIFLTEWKNLDFLIIDMPPGSGDISLTLFQNLSVDGVVLVTTGQSLALQDSLRSIAMIDKLKLPLLGIVESMSSIQCPNCNETIPMYDKQDFNSFIQTNKIELLGEIVINPKLTEKVAESKLLEPYTQIAQKILSQLDKLEVSLPKIKYIND